jgi:hypothetical protein
VAAACVVVSEFRVSCESVRDAFATTNQYIALLFHTTNRVRSSADSDSATLKRLVTFLHTRDGFFCFPAQNSFYNASSSSSSRE